MSEGERVSAVRIRRGAERKEVKDLPGEVRAVLAPLVAQRLRAHRRDREQTRRALQHRQALRLNGDEWHAARVHRERGGRAGGDAQGK